MSFPLGGGIYHEGKVERKKMGSIGGGSFKKYQIPCFLIHNARVSKSKGEERLFVLGEIYKVPFPREELFLEKGGLRILGGGGSLSFFLAPSKLSGRGFCFSIGGGWPSSSPGEKGLVAANTEIDGGKALSEKSFVRGRGRFFSLDGGMGVEKGERFSRSRRLSQLHVRGLRRPWRGEGKWLARKKKTQNSASLRQGD